MNIAIIPARFNSKRIPNKNIKFFFGKPIIYYSINLAIKSKIFDKVIVSTDSKKIKKIAEKYGAEVPFIRPKHLSNDFASTLAVIKHAVTWYLKKNFKINNVCCIYPASPLLKKKYLIEGYKKIKSNNWKYVFSASKHEKSIHRSFSLNKRFGVSMLMPKYYSYSSKLLEDTYLDAGSFYWGKKDSWLDSNSQIFSSKSTIVEIPSYEAQDIDTIEDWKKLTLKFKK